MRYSFILVFIFGLVTITSAQEDTVIIHFDLDKAAIRPTERAALDSLAHAKGIKSITIAGHADSIGSDKLNDILSLARASNTKSYLLSKGLPDSLIKSTAGYGRRQPRDPLDPAGNRRVEIMLVHIKAPSVVRPTPVVSPTTQSEPPAIPVNPDDGLLEALKDTTNIVGRNFILRNVNFYGDRHVPLPEAAYPLLQLLNVMKRYPRMSIEIQGYVCCMRDDFDGRDADLPTEKLSVQRAKFVYDFLVKNGIAKSRMKYKGFGASKKIFPEERTPEERSANRRVEIKVLGFN